MKNDLLSTILSNTFTLADLNKRIHLLRECLEYQYFSEAKTSAPTLHEYLMEKKVPAADAEALAGWGDEFMGQFTRDTAYNLLDEIKKATETLPILTMYLPYFPDSVEVTKIGLWCRENFNPKIVIDMKRDLTLIGGCAIVAGGVYRDFSMRYYLEKNREAIIKVLDDYKVRGTEIGSQPTNPPKTPPVVEVSQ